nr:ATP-dependent Clp protease proteolytic subunit [uncultured Oscillibacter sp.]
MITPNITKETCEGTACIPIQDALFRRREIYCTGEIDAETANSIIVQLHFLSIEDPTGEITLYINSPGGEVSSGLAMYDAMQAVSCPVKTVCVGMAASMAAVLFCSGAKREILPHARILVHDPVISGSIGGSALKLDSVAKDLMQTRETMGRILAKHTGHSLEDVLSKTAMNSYFNASEAVAWGLADRVIERF